MLLFGFLGFIWGETLPSTAQGPRATTSNNWPTRLNCSMQGLKSAVPLELWSAEDHQNHPGDAQGAPEPNFFVLETPGGMPGGACSGEPCSSRIKPEFHTYKSCAFDPCAASLPSNVLTSLVPLIFHIKYLTLLISQLKAWYSSLFRF